MIILHRYLLIWVGKVIFIISKIPTPQPIFFQLWEKGMKANLFFYYKIFNSFFFFFRNSECRWVPVDKNARDVFRLPFYSGARSWFCYPCLLWLQWYSTYTPWLCLHYYIDSFSNQLISPNLKLLKLVWSLQIMAIYLYKEAYFGNGSRPLGTKIIIILHHHLKGMDIVWTCA